MNSNKLLIHHKRPNIFWFDKYAKNINKQKQKIDDDDISEYWTEAKKYTNKYELVYSPYKELQNEILLKKKVLSRAYYKFYEIIHQYSLYNYYKTSIRSLHIAEGPGGFIQAWNDSRKSHGITDDIYGITLKGSKQKNIKGWEYGKNYFKNHKNITVDYGVDETGNLFNIDNIKHIIDNYIDKKANLITGDGGFDFSNDFCSQENNMIGLLFIQFYLAIRCQAINGNFLIKVFDIFEAPTIQLIELMAELYGDFFIIKPRTSRQANSEKYILFIGFKGLSIDKSMIWNSLLSQILDYYKHKNGYINRLNMMTINKSFLDNMQGQLLPFLSDQLKNLDETHNLIDMMKNKHKDLKKHKAELRSIQLKNSKDWINTFL